MIALEDVCCAFDHEPVLRHISFTIKKGEAVLLTGPNGSGKTTLLRLLNGLVFPELGTYTFEGTAITAKKMGKARYLWVTIRSMRSDREISCSCRR